MAPQRLSTFRAGLSAPRPRGPRSTWRRKWHFGLEDVKQLMEGSSAAPHSLLAASDVGGSELSLQSSPVSPPPSSSLAPSSSLLPSPPLPRSAVVQLQSMCCEHWGHRAVTTLPLS